MNKTFYNKWQELLDLKIDDSRVVITNCFLSLEAKTRLYIGRSLEAQFVYIEFAKSSLDNLNLPIVKGLETIRVSEPKIDKTKDYIKISNKTNNKELFVAFSSSLYDLLVNTTDYYSAYNALVITIKEYQSFFSNVNISLSLQEEQGLCAELIELSALIDKKGEDVVMNWMGPSRNKRDFLFDKTALEIKSTLGQVDSSILISNENQLTLSFPYTLEKLFLKVYILEKSKDGIDIVSTAQEILSKLSNINNKSCFIVNLLKMKVDLKSYKCKYHFSIQDAKRYSVVEPFPKISKEMLAKGIFNVKYRVHLDAIKEFEITEEELYEQL